MQHIFYSYLALFILALMGNSALSATVSVYETEPNNTPVEAGQVSGAVQLLGTLEAGDQDGFRWAVSDVDAQKTWNFTFQGLPGQLSVVDIIHVEYADNGVEVASRTKLFTLGSRDGAKPVALENLIFPPGEYLLGIAQGPAGGGFRPPVVAAGFEQNSAGVEPVAEVDPVAYRLEITEGEHLRSRSGGNAPTDKSTAKHLRLNGKATVYHEPGESWFSLNIKDEHVSRRWELKGQAPVGHSVTASLRAADGVELATSRTNSYGKYAFPDLGLATGDYYLRLTGDQAGIQSVSMAETGTVIEGREAEPNNTWKLANRASLEQPISGRMGKAGEYDYFQVEVDEGVSDHLQSLVLNSSSTGKVTLCLTNAGGKKIQCRAGSGTVVLPDLQLLPGNWGIVVGRGPADLEYSVSLESQGVIVQGAEAEPNDSYLLATAMPDKLRVKGRLNAGDSDFYKLLVTGKPELWRIQVMGDAIHELAYHDASGNSVQVYRTARDQRRVRLENLYLMPGVHYIRVDGRGDGKYTLLARRVGAPDKNVELEPNDDITRMNLLAMGQTRTGLLADDQDKDNYRFHLANRDHIRLRIQPPVDGAVAAQLYWDGTRFKEFNNPQIGEIVDLEGVFPPGDYRLAIYPGVVSVAEYKLSLERLPRFSCSADCEPNDNSAFANPLPASGIVVGRVNEWRDSDWFSLPVHTAPRNISVALEPQRRIELRDSHGGELPLERDRESGLYLGRIPAAEQAYLFLYGWGEPDYRMQVVFDVPDAAPRDPNEFVLSATAQPALDIQLQLQLESTRVAAYHSAGQRLSGTVMVKNVSGSDQDISLQATTSDHRWAVEIQQSDIHLAPGDVENVALQVVVPADAWAREPVRISVGASNDEGAQRETGVEIHAGGDVAAVNPELYWPLPNALLGSFNLAWAALGGRWADDFDTAVGSGFEQAIDGMAVKKDGLGMRGTYKDPFYITVALSGGEATRIAGVAITLLGDGGAQQHLKNFDLYVSSDGEDFELAYQGELLPLASEQAFVLDEPVSARYARLLVRDTFSGVPMPGGGILGEFKVIATQEADPSAGRGFNLADPALGGHVVWSRPADSSGKWDSKLLGDTATYQRRRVNSGNKVEWVLGMHHDRAAQITRLGWYNAEQSDPAQRIAEVDVAVSLNSPLGPWRSLGKWQLDTAELETQWSLDTPTWARFVKFTAPPAVAQSTVALPASLDVWERPSDQEYRSILTEWGFSSNRAIYEYLHPPQLAQAMTSVEHTRRENARPLAVDSVAQGQVLLDQVDNWYKFVMPEGHNTLTLTLSGEATVRSRLLLEDEAGDVVPTVFLKSVSEPGKHTMEAFVQPGTRLYLKIFEPARNVVFLWDTSASVGAYLPVIYNALASYSAGLVPGRDAANVIPFGSQPLLRDWYGDPYVLQNILNDYPRKESSSAAEKTLHDATRALAPRAGSKAIVMVTDAATGQYAQMWDQFAEVRPRIFAVGVSSAGAFGPNPVREQDLMQDWAAVNGGYYSHVLNEGAMEVAFDRASTLLRAPAPYSIVARTSFREAPGPGRIEVTGASFGVGDDGAVELILDASGSMLKRVGGTRRIEIARQVLTNAVNNYIPPGTPVALRVFGHREANACRTDLEMPLAPLNPARTTETISKINAMNLAKTPIADSLQQAASDLQKARGKKIIILVTDGEETCDGDAAGVIEGLVSQGFDMTLNIVGFAIDEDALEAQFEDWARLGGGEYFSADGRAGLEASILEALSIPYQVYLPNGEVAASGVVGGPGIELPQGEYRVVVQSRPRKVFESVLVPGGKTVSLKAD